MPTLEEMQDWRGLDVYGSDDDKIGSLDEIYVDQASGEPEWFAVNTGLFGTSSSIVPSARAVRDGDRVLVPYPKDLVKDAPQVDADRDLSPDEERRLYDHYGVAWGDYDYDATAGREETEMTRSEEELVVGKREQETGRARLRKHVVTDEVETTVPVKREEVRVEREPIAEGAEGEPIREEESEVTLHAEEPVVEKRTVPQERVRLEKEERVEERPVSEEVRREEIETDPPRRR